MLWLINSSSSVSPFDLELGRTHFVSSEFGFLKGSGGFFRLILVEKSGFRRVQSSVFLDLGLVLAHFWPNRFKVWAFWRGSKFGLSG